MSALAASTLPDRQRRLLAYMGIELYVRRGAAAAGAPAPATTPAPAPAAATLQLLVRLDGDAPPLLARHRRLVEHLIAALGVDRACARIDSGGTAPVDVALLCLGAAPGDHPRALLGPPLAALAASGRAKAGLWRELRRFRARAAGA